jgi:hypothetical protein
MSGENPLRWDCEKQGCFNLKKRPKIQVFAECFPRNIQMGDVDGAVEFENREIVLEWKSYRDVSKGQHIMFTRLTDDKRKTVIVVSGDAETMCVDAYGVYYGGRWYGWFDTDLSGVKEFFSRWVEWAQKNRWLSRRTTVDSELVIEEAAVEA